MEEGEPTPRDRFCRELNDDMGKLIFAQVDQCITVAICGGVCKAWRTMTALHPLHPNVAFAVTPVTAARWTRIMPQAFFDFVKREPDANMACLRLWMPNLRRIFGGPDIVDAANLAVQWDKPTALRMFIVHHPERTKKHSHMWLEQAIHARAPLVLEQLLIPAAAFEGMEFEPFRQFFVHATRDLFVWYCTRHLGWISLDPERFKLEVTPLELEDKIVFIRDHKPWSLDTLWWLNWFGRAAGISNVTLKLDKVTQYFDYELLGPSCYNRYVAVAIVKHVLHVIPEGALDYLHAQNFAATASPNGILLEALRPWYPDDWKPSARGAPKFRRAVSPTKAPEWFYALTGRKRHTLPQQDDADDEPVPAIQSRDKRGKHDYFARGFSDDDDDDDDDDLDEPEITFGGTVHQ